MVGLRGDPDHPVTRGRLCPKARFQLDRHRSAARLLVPLVRSGDRLLPSSWEAALDLVAEKLLAARAQAGSLSVMHYWDSGSMGLLKNLYQRLFNLFGGVTEPHGSLCWSAGLAAQEADFGRVLAHSPDDLVNAGAVVIWGRNPADTNPHLMIHLVAARDRGVPMVVIDPVRTATVRELGARHIAPRPGTDAVLALAVAGELVRRGAWDRDFCRERANGFEAFAAQVTSLDLEQAALACGLEPEDVLELADLLARRKEGRPAAFLIGYGLQRYARGGETVRAIDALAAVAGSIGIPGGGANYANRHASGVVRNLAGEEFARARRYFDRAAFGRQVPGLDPPVKVLFCDRANPVAQLPNAKRVAETVRRVEFKVVADLSPTDTVALADVALPVADFLEDEDLYLCSWHTYLTWAVPAVRPPGQARPETAVIADLAERLGLGGHFDLSPAGWIAYALEPMLARCPNLAPDGETLRLRGRSFANPVAEVVPWSDGRFATPSGRFEFGRRWACLEGLAPTGEREAVAGGRAAATGEKAGAAGATGKPSGRVFHLITPQHRFSLHSQFYDEVLRRTSRNTGLPAVFLNPRAARGLGLADGSEVVVESAQGRLKAFLVHDDGLREDTALIYSGGTAGLTGRGLAASANLLTPDHLSDIGTQAAYYDCLCAVRRAD